MNSLIKHERNHLGVAQSKLVTGLTSVVTVVRGPDSLITRGGGAEQDVHTITRGGGDE